MANMTQRMMDFAMQIAMGVKGREAAIAAGYAAGSAHDTASKLLARADVKAEVKRVRASKGVTNTRQARGGPTDIGDEKPLMKPKYDSSLHLLQDLYNNPKAPPALRFEAAKQALPYEHAKLGEQGKKAAAKEKAKEIAGGSKFQKKQPPRLRVVN